MAKNCYYCDKPLPLPRRLMGKSLHADCEKEQRKYLASYEDELLQTGETTELREETRNKIHKIVETGKLQDSQVHEVNVRVYSRLKEKMLKDGDFTEVERDYLNQLQGFLNLSDEEADSQRLDHLRHVAWICEGNLPEIETTVRLRKGEVAYYEGFTIWQHLKTRKQRVAGSRGQSVRVAKGFSFKVGATPGYTKEWEEFQTVDEGRVIVTSQRLLFVGAKKNLNIKHEKILDLEYFSDAVKVYRGTVNPTYFFMDDPSVFFAVLSTVLETQDD